jgi:hypothetical protein
MNETVYSNQVSWVNETLMERRSEFGRSVPALVFVHIPFEEIETAKEDGGECWGVNLDGVTPTTDDAGLFSLLSSLPEVRAVFSGHDHCNSFCCALGGEGRGEGGGLDLCFGRHSSFGGYGCEGEAEEIGARVVDVTVTADGGVALETHIRLASGGVEGRHAL